METEEIKPKKSTWQMIRRILRNMRRRQPLVLVLMILIIIIILLGAMLGLRKCVGNGSGYPDLTDELLDGEEIVYNRLDAIVLKTTNTRYGLSIDDYEVQEGKIESGETFSKLLNNRFGVNMNIVNRLIEKCNGVFNLRDIRAGNAYTAFMTGENNEQLCYLVYEKNRSEYITFGVSDSLFVQVDKKEVRIEERYSEGVISSSLYATIYDEGLSPSLADQMAKIYASTIDFFALQKGDRFRVVYEEEFIDTLSIGVTKIYGVEFTHGKKPHYAFRFEQDGEFGYWDEKGVNLQGALLLSPLKFSARVTSKFGSRVHPIRRIRTMHNGVDYACPIGTPVHSVADGVVTRRGWDSKGGGNFVWIKHPNGIESGYLHLSRFAVTVGQRVRQGQLIAYSGNTGGSTGPHLDYRLKKNGKFINPLNITSMPKEPIKAGNKAAFDKMKDDVLKVLDEYAKR